MRLKEVEELARCLTSVTVHPEDELEFLLFSCAIFKVVSVLKSYNDGAEGWDWLAGLGRSHGKRGREDRQGEAALPGCLGAAPGSSAPCCGLHAARGHRAKHPEREETIPWGVGSVLNNYGRSPRIGSFDRLQGPGALRGPGPRSWERVSAGAGVAWITAPSCGH